MTRHGHLPGRQLPVMKSHNGQRDHCQRWHRDFVAHIVTPSGDAHRGRFGATSPGSRHVRRAISRRHNGQTAHYTIVFNPQSQTMSRMNNSSSICLKLFPYCFAVGRCQFCRRQGFRVRFIIHARLSIRANKPIPVSLDGFSGEVADVLKFDLYVQGFSSSRRTPRNIKSAAATAAT